MIPRAPDAFLLTCVSRLLETETDPDSRGIRVLQTKHKLLRIYVTVSHLYLCNCFLHSGNCYPHLGPSVPWFCPSVPWFRHLLPRGVAVGPLLPRRLAPSPEGACRAGAVSSSASRGALFWSWRGLWRVGWGCKSEQRSSNCSEALLFLNERMFSLISRKDGIG